MTPAGKVYVVVTAAGQSRRMAGTDKLTLDLDGRPLLAQSVLALLTWPRTEALAVTVTPGREVELEGLLQEHLPRTIHGKLSILSGGDERQDSVRRGLEHLSSLHSPMPEDVAFIHDGARPFVDAALFDNLLRTLESCDGVIPATPVRDTVKRVSGDTVLHTEDRETLRMVQTPQAFPFNFILQLHRKAREEQYLGTDDASLVERYGGQVRWIVGPAHNLKVTVPEDIALLTELRKNHLTEPRA